MAPFEYLSVLISIILGLGLTDLLSSLQRLIHVRDRVRFHWLPLLWAGIAFVALVQWWWAAFGLRDQLAWDFFSFLLVLAVPVLLYLVASLVLPNVEPNTVYDLRAHYFRTHRLFFGVVTAVGAIEVIRAVLVADVQAGLLNGASGVLALTLIATRNVWYHAVVSVVMALLLLSVIVLETLRIG